LSNTTQNIARDFTEYKFKYFTNLDSFLKGADALNTPKLFNAVCVKKCPTDVPLVDMVSSKVQECMINDDVKVCPGYDNIFINTTVIYGYCMPETDNAESAVGELYKQINEQLGFA
jgi:hypothetical protein